MLKTMLATASFAASFAALTSLATPVNAQTGYATWYGNENHQWRRADGKPYHPSEIGCAHRTIKLGTLIRVTNLKNGRSVVCPVNDRGPYAHGAILDLSIGARNAIGAGGLTRVSIEIVSGRFKASLYRGTHILPTPRPSSH